MNPTAAQVADRLSLRPPQRTALDRIANMAEALGLPSAHGDRPGFLAVKSSNRDEQLAAIRALLPELDAFDRAFPSAAFALATGVGKTRLMGAAIAYLHRAHGVRHFLVLAPNLTIYDKTIRDFTLGDPRYVLTGLHEFATQPPVLITGENFASGVGTRGLGLDDEVVHVNVFNIAKLNTEVRGGATPRIKRLQETIGESYFDYLARLDDLVLLMDESHRYRAAAGMRAIDELNPLIGLEFTATPFVERGAKRVPFKNVAYRYGLGEAIRDGWVKRPAVATRAGLSTSDMLPEALDHLKLADGLRLHEETRAELEAYALTTGSARVKPFMLVVAADTSHAAELERYIKSAAFAGGGYRDRTITVHSNQSGEEKDEVVARLLAVERADEPTEIVIHVNMLKEGWDVTNLFTIVPLRTAASAVLVEQSLGRGLRLPFGRRTGVAPVDTLTVVAHEHFAAIVKAAQAAGSPFALEERLLPEDSQPTTTLSIAATSLVDEALGAAVPHAVTLPYGAAVTTPVLTTPQAKAVAAEVLVLLREEGQLPTGPSARHEAAIVLGSKALLRANEAQIAGVTADVAAQIASRVLALAEANTIPIPRFALVPRGEVVTVVDPAVLDVNRLRWQPVPVEILVAYLQGEGRREVVATGADPAAPPQSQLLAGLAALPFVDYERHGESLRNLVTETVSALRSRLGSDDAVANVVQYHFSAIISELGQQLAGRIRVEAPDGYEVRTLSRASLPHDRGFTAYATSAALPVTQQSDSIRRAVYDGFKRCSFRFQRFDSDPERRFAVLLEQSPNENVRWFRPTERDIEIVLPDGARYIPDFVVDVGDARWLVEVKANNEMNDPDVQAKRFAALSWCAHASEASGFPWHYALVPESDLVPSATLTTVMAPGRDDQ